MILVRCAQTRHVHVNVLTPCVWRDDRGPAIASGSRAAVLSSATPVVSVGVGVADEISGFGFG